MNCRKKIHVMQFNMSKVYSLGPAIIESPKQTKIFPKYYTEKEPQSQNKNQHRFPIIWRQR